VGALAGEESGGEAGGVSAIRRREVSEPTAQFLLALGGVVVNFAALDRS
jgi:hypothetical protein